MPSLNSVHLIDLPQSCTTDACNEATGQCETQDVDCYAELGIPETNLCTQVGCDAFQGCLSPVFGLKELARYHLSIFI